MKPKKTPKTEVSLTAVMNYIKGEEIDPEALRQYSNLLRNFKGNFKGFLAMTAYKQMSRLGRLLDSLEMIEERLYMDADSNADNYYFGSESITTTPETVGTTPSSETEDTGYGVLGGRGKHSEQIKPISECDEGRLLAMSHRITIQVQSTLSFLMNLLDRIESKDLPDDMGEMITKNKALPESSTNKQPRLDASARGRIREMIHHLEKNLEQ